MGSNLVGSIFSIESLWKGAQFSCLTYECAKNIKADYLIDKTYTGEATGVGKQGILGKIHQLEFIIENNFYKMLEFFILNYQWYIIFSGFYIMENLPEAIVLGKPHMNF